MSRTIYLFKPHNLLFIENHFTTPLILKSEPVFRVNFFLRVSIMFCLFWIFSVKYHIAMKRKWQEQPHSINCWEECITMTIIISSCSGIEFKTNHKTTWHFSGNTWLYQVVPLVVVNGCNITTILSPLLLHVVHCTYANHKLPLFSFIVAIYFFYFQAKPKIFLTPQYKPPHYVLFYFPLES